MITSGQCRYNNNVSFASIAAVACFRFPSYFVKKIDMDGEGDGHQPSWSSPPMARTLFDSSSSPNDGNQEIADRLNLARTTLELRSLRREYSLTLERLDGLQSVVQAAVREKALLEISLHELHQALSEREADFQDTIRTYSSIVTAEKNLLQKELDDTKLQVMEEQRERQEQNNMLCEILEEILRSDKTPYLVFQGVSKRVSRARKPEEFLPLKRLQQLCHKISIQQLASEHRNSGVLRRKMSSHSRSQSRGRKSKPRPRRVSPRH